MLPSILFELAIVILGAAATVPPHRSEPLHIPIVRRYNARRGGEADLVRLTKAAQHLKGKYGYGPPSLSRRLIQDIGITNQDQDTIYFAQVDVGTPPQSFGLILDTGSSDLWFATTGCSGCSLGTPLLDTTESSSFQTRSVTIPLRYGSGSATGTLASDTVSMGPLTVTQQDFVAVSTVSSGFISGELSGIMGLAFQGLAKTGAVPFWQALIANNLLSNPEFSFAMTRFDNDQSATQEEPGGVLTLGGINSTLHKGSIDFRTFTPSVANGSFWLQTISSFDVNDTSVDIGNSTLAAIDTGTSLIGGPSKVVTSIWSVVPGAKPLKGQMTGYWGFPCTTQFTVSISFGGPSWPISFDDLNLGTMDGVQCVGAIFDIGQATDNRIQSIPPWVIGITFLKNVYSVFRASDPPAVGFALLSQEILGSSGTPGPVTGTPRVSGVLPTSTPSDASPARQVTSFSNVGVLATSVLSLLTVVLILAT